MTIEEFNALEDIDGECWIEIREDHLRRWHRDKATVELPYPENFLRFVYGEYEVIDKNYERAADEALESLPENLQSIAVMIFKEHRNLEYVSQKMRQMDITVYSFIHKAARLLRHPSRRRLFRDIVEFKNREEYCNGRKRIKK